MDGHLSVDTCGCDQRPLQSSIRQWDSELVLLEVAEVRRSSWWQSPRTFDSCPELHRERESPHEFHRCFSAPSLVGDPEQGSNPYHEIHIWIHNVDPYPYHSIPRGLQHFHIHATEPLPHVPDVEIVENFRWGSKIHGFPCEIAHILSTFYHPQQHNIDLPPCFPPYTKFKQVHSRGFTVTRVTTPNRNGHSPSYQVNHIRSRTNRRRQSTALSALQKLDLDGERRQGASIGISVRLRYPAYQKAGTSVGVLSLRQATADSNGPMTKTLTSPRDGRDPLITIVGRSRFPFHNFHNMDPFP
jgi:hypothetical protein